MKTRLDGKVEVLRIGSHASIIRDGEGRQYVERVDTVHYQRIIREMIDEGQMKEALSLVAEIEEHLPKQRVDLILKNIKD